jgi:hypothetical protein
MKETFSHKVDINKYLHSTGAAVGTIESCPLARKGNTATNAKHFQSGRFIAKIDYVTRYNCVRYYFPQPFALQIK